MRLMVRRLNSPLMASNPKPIATRGIRKPSTAMKDGSGSWASVKSRRKRNGSCEVVVLRSWIAVKIAPIPVRSTSHSSTRIRPLPRWSANSFKKTVPHPVQIEPLRRAMSVLEIVAIDRIEARLDMVEPHQRAARSDHGLAQRRAHILARDDAEFALPVRRDAQHAGDAREHRLEVRTRRLDLDRIAAAQNLLRQLGDRSLQRHL